MPTLNKGVHLRVYSLYKGGIEKNRNRHPRHHATHLLVAACTTSQQPTTPADQKTQPKAQSLGCGCAKGLFRTTTNTKNAKQP